MKEFNQKECQTVVLAALMHDVGKFFEIEELLDTYRKEEKVSQGKCYRDQKEGYDKHMHLLHTRVFCEILAKQIPSLLPEAVIDMEKSDQDWINLAARHHTANTTLKKIIEKADQFSSSEGKPEDFCATTISRKFRLEPVIEKIFLRHNSKIDPQYAFEIRALSLEKDTLFPKPIKNLEAQTDAHLPAKGHLKAAYRCLGKEMLEEVNRLPKALSFYVLLETLLALFEKYLSYVPAATNISHPDISLYDHLRMTAAIADGLYRYESQKEKQTDAPWILVCGDFSGIQKFIYRITSKGAAKSIRGRSLFVQLLCDGAADYILRRIEGYTTSKIYSSGGKFYLLVSSVCRQAVYDAVEIINEYLLSEFGGEVFLGVGIASMTAKHFEQGKMSERWEAVNADLMENRKQRFAAQIEKYENFFDPPSIFKPNKGSCQICGRNDLPVIEYPDVKRRICRVCEQLERLGSRLKDARYFLWTFNTVINDTLYATFGRKADLDLSKLGIQLFVLKDLKKLKGFAGLSDCRIERINSTDLIHNLEAGSTFRFLGHWDSAKDSGDWEFDDFADKSVGIRRLGILRMDVDNLGQVFIKGLRFPDGKKSDSERVEENSEHIIERKPMASISRVATLSRQLNTFFSGYLGKLLKEYERCQIIYAGGDDLFIIGSWDELPEVAGRIREEFQTFCCENPDMSLCGGLVLTGGKYPISRGAEHAAAAEELAKLCREQKDAFCFLDEPLSWNDFISAKYLTDLFQGIVIDKNKGFLDRVRNIVLANKTLGREKQRMGMSITEIQKRLAYEKWRWQIAYSLKRYVRRGERIEKKVNAVQDALFKDIVNGDKTEKPVIHWLGLPTRWAEFLERKGKE